MADFFDNEDKTEEVKPEAPQTFKIGEREFTQEEMNRRIGLSDMALEVEQKYNTKLDKVYPEYTKATQRIRDFEQAEEERKRREVDNKPTEELTAEQIKNKVIAEADQYGLIHKGNVLQEVVGIMEAYKMRDRMQTIVADAEAKGIKTSEEAIREHMEKEGFRNPEKAFKDMYQSELTEFEKRQEEKIKLQGLVTDGTSTAGFKVPDDVKIDRSNLNKLLTEALSEAV